MTEQEKIIEELREKVAFLEKQENKRIRKKKITITLKVIKVLAILTIIFLIYYRVNNKVIKPMQEKLDLVETKYDDLKGYVEEKYDGIKGYLEDKIDFVQKYIPGKKND